MNNHRIKFFFAGGLALATIIALTGHVWAALAIFWLLQVIISPRSTHACANALGTLATATIVQEALALVFAKRPVLNNMSLGFTDRDGSPIAAFNQPVITRTLGLPTVQDAGSGASDRTDTDVSVTLNQYKQVEYLFTPQQYSGTNRDLVRESAEPMAVAMANFMVDSIAANFIPANFPNRAGADAVANGATITKTTKGAGWDYSHLTDIRSTLNKAGVPDFKRFYLGNSDVYGSMLNDPRIVAYFNNQSNADAIKTGKLPVVAGFGLDEYPNLSAVTNAAAAGSNIVAVCGSPDAVVYAHRVPRDPRDVIKGLPFPGNIGIVTEPRTGLSVMVVEYIDPATLNVITKLMWMFGTAIGNANNLQYVTNK